MPVHKTKQHLKQQTGQTISQILKWLT